MRHDARDRSLDYEKIPSNVDRRCQDWRGRMTVLIYLFKKKESETQASRYLTTCRRCTLCPKENLPSPMSTVIITVAPDGGLSPMYYAINALLPASSWPQSLPIHSMY